MTNARRSGNPARRMTSAAPALSALRSLAVDNAALAIATDPSPYPLPPLKDPHRIIQGILGGLPNGKDATTLAPEGGEPVPGHYDATTVVTTVIYQPGLLNRLLADRRRDLAAHQVTTVTQQRARERTAIDRTVTPYVRVIVLTPLDDERLPIDLLAEITHASEVSRPYGIQLMAATNAPLESYLGTLASTGRRGYLAAIAKNFLDMVNVGRDTQRARLDAAR